MRYIRAVSLACAVCARIPTAASKQRAVYADHYGPAAAASTGAATFLFRSRRRQARRTGAGAVPRPQTDHFGSAPAGTSEWPCSTSIAQSDFPACAVDNAVAFRSLSLSLKRDFDTIHDMTNYMYLIGKPLNNSRLRPCRYIARASDDSPSFQVSLDFQYSNKPRCCVDLDQALGARNDDVENVLAQLPVEHGNMLGLNYSRLTPASKTCSSRFPCPLVVEVPGAAGLPWLLLQQNCKRCRNELGVVMVALETQGETSTEFVKISFVPVVQHFMAPADIDEERVYLVSASQGNEVAFNAVLSNAHIFSFALLSGKFLLSRDIRKEVPDALQSVANSKLAFVSLVIGEDDTVRDESQDFFHKLNDLREHMRKSPQFYFDLHLRFLPGSRHAVWYTAWNMFHDLVWRGRGHPRDYKTLEPLTC